MTYADQSRTAGSGVSTGGTAANLKRDAEATAGRVGASVQRAKDDITEAASSASGALSDDFGKLSADVASLKDTVTKLASTMGGHVSRAASEIGSDIASTAKDQASTMATEFEKMARKNPIAVVAGALALGLFIGLLRGRS